MTIKRILVPVDFSSHSLAALEYAVGFAKPFKAQVIVLHAVEPIYLAVPDFAGAGAASAMGELLAEQRRSGRAELVRLERRYARRRVKLRALLQVAAAHRAIATAAKQVRADLVIMATHGRTGVSHLLMGSVAERVVRGAPCPVLTLRPRAAALRRKSPRVRAARTSSTRRARSAR